MTATRNELWDRYGKPIRRTDRIPGEVFVFAHRTSEAADAYADANNANSEVVSTVEFYSGSDGAWPEGEWWTVVDLRPFLERLAREFKEAHP